MKYKIAHCPPQQTTNGFGMLQVESYAPHGHSPFRALDGVFVFCEDIAVGILVGICCSYDYFIMIF